jgi:hypothetical protein
MGSTITEIRTALASQLGTIRGLRVEASVPDQPKPPTAVVIPQGIRFDVAMGRGTDEYDFSIIVIVGRVSDRTSQASMDSFCNSVGTQSIKACVVSDPTLGGVVQSARVTDMQNYGALTVGDTEYLSAQFAVTVYA